MKQSFVNCKNGTVYYWHTDIDTTKKTLFLLHGLTANHTMFEKQVNFFKDVYNVIIWDAPAHGKSRPYSDFSYENAVAVMLQILNDSQIQEVVLVGQSMGGYMAQSFIARYPEMVKGFVSIDSTPFGDYYSLKQIEWMCKPFSEKLLKVSMAKQNAVTEAGRENMLEMVSDYEKEELCRLMGIGYAGFLDDNKELKISCPSLILVGEKDNTGKVTIIRSAMQQHIAMNGPTDSRVLISIMARRFKTTKQRISGNISYMVCKAGTLSIIRNKPHSILY